MDKNQPSLNRQILVFWLALVVFGCCAIFLPDWSNPSTQKGALIGLAVVVGLLGYIILHWDRQLTARELQKAKATKSNASYRAALAFAAGLGLACTALFSKGSLQSSMGGLVYVLLTGCSLLALVLAYAKKGSFQKPRR
jgi:uncharacterized membrane-anchored protein